MAHKWAATFPLLLRYNRRLWRRRAAAIQAAKPLLTTLRVMPIPEAVPVPVVGQYIGEDGVFRPSDPIAAGVKPMLDELARWTAALKPLRG